MLRTIPASAVLGLLAAAVVAAERPAGPDPTALVAQLGSPEFARREAAAKALDALGEAALPALRKALAESADAELADRADDLFARITRRVENARLIAPTRVALDLSDAPATDALAAVEKQSGYKFFLPTDAVKAVRDKKVTVRTDGPVPFWEAVEKVCAAAGLQVVGPPQADPRYVTHVEVLGNRGVAPAGLRPAAPPVGGFVPAVPAAPPAPKPEDPEAKKKAAEKQAAMEKAAANLAAAEALRKLLVKEADKAVQPKADGAKPAAPNPQQQQAAQLAALQADLAALREREALLRARTNPPPYSPTALYLVPRAGPRPPADADTAVKVEALANVADHQTGCPDDTLLVLLQATPEPKLGLETLTDVRVTRAVADSGRELVANKVGPGGPATIAVTELAVQRQLIVQQKRQVLILNAAGGLERRTSPVSATGHQQVLVRLKAPDAPVTKLAELFGVLVGTVRTPPTEAVAVTDLYPKNGPPQAYRGHQGATLRAAVTDENIDDTFTLDVTLAYPSNRVRQAAAGRDEALISAALATAHRGRPAGETDANLESMYQRAGVLFQGLVLTDAAGVPFRITASTQRQFPVRGNAEMSTRTYRLTAAPTADGQGKPAKLAFYATWQKPVEVPFTLTGVPVATGSVKR